MNIKIVYIIRDGNIHSTLFSIKLIENVKTILKRNLILLEFQFENIGVYDDCHLHLWKK